MSYLGTDRTPRIPLNLFGIPFGLLGLADCWLTAAGYGLAPITLGRILMAIAVAVWAVILLAYLRGVKTLGISVGSELADATVGPFAALVPLIPTLAAAEVLYPLSHPVGAAITDAGIVTVLLLAGWFIGQWIYRPVDLARVHPGYFLPSVAGGFIASISAARVGETHLAEMLFGLGILSWIVLGSIVLGRLILGPSLPDPLIPTLAIEVAPAAVATAAWFAIDGQQVDTVVRLLAGYGLLMVVAQVRLLPAFRRLRFQVSTWAFTFSWASVAFAGLSWLGITHPQGWQIGSAVILGSISAFIGAIGLRTALAITHGKLLPSTASPLTRSQTETRPTPPAGSPGAPTPPVDPPTRPGRQLASSSLVHSPQSTEGSADGFLR